jgi:protein-L-isoaspartate O-methyltransferase
MKRFFLFFLVASSLHAEDGEWRPPFITTPPEVVERMLELAATRAGDFVVDLGSGDGRIVIAAAQSFGASGLGIELDAELVKKSRQNADRARVAEKARFVQGDALTADLSRATVLTVYLLPALMAKLQSRFIDELAPGTRIVSHSFTMAGWPPDRIETVRLRQRHPGQGDESRLYLWIVPADVRGSWSEGELEVRIEQNYQHIEVEGAGPGKVSGRDVAWPGFKGRIEGGRIAGELGGRRIELERR